MRYLTGRILLSVTLIATVLAGCAPAATPTPTPPKPPAAAPTVAPAAPTAAPAAKPTAAATTAPAAAPKPTVAAAAPTAAAAPKPATSLSLPFGLASVNMNYPGYLIADELKIFDKHGVKPELTLTQTSATALQALISRSLGVAAIATDAAVLAQVKSPDLVMVTTVVVNTPYSLMANPRTKTVQDLKGKTLGASSPTTADGYMVRTMLAHYGLQDQRDYTIIVTGDPAARAEAVRQGKVEGLAALEPQLSQLKAEGFNELIRGGLDVPRLAKWPLIQLVSNRAWASANQEALVRFLRAWLEAIQVTYDPARKDEVIKILSTRLKVDQKYVTSAYQNLIVDQRVFSKDGQISLENLQNVIDAMMELGDVPKPGPKPADLVDTSYLQKARQP